MMSLITVGPTSAVDVLVTDSGAPSDQLEQLRKKGVDVRVTEAARLTMIG